VRNFQGRSEFTEIFREDDARIGGEAYEGVKSGREAQQAPIYLGPPRRANSQPTPQVRRADSASDGSALADDFLAEADGE